jgi:putative redox protein
MKDGRRQELRRSERVEFQCETISLAGIIDRPESTPKGSVLFAHCFTCNKDLKAIVRISRRLAANGWEVLRFDFRGLGNSQGDFSASNFTTNQSDLLAAAKFLEGVRSEYSLTPESGAHFLIGHSFGGACALASVASIPSARGVAVIAAPSDTQHLAQLLLKMDPQIAETGQGTVSIGGRTYTILEQMVEDFRSHDLPKIIANVDRPVIIFHSPTDETVGYHHATRIFALLSQSGSPSEPDAVASSPAAPAENHCQPSLYTLPNSDHLLISHPADIDLVADTINVWADRLMIDA